MGARLRGQSRAAALLITVVALSAMGWIASARPAQAAADQCRAQHEDVVDAADVGRAERSLLCLINVHRVAHGVPVLTGDARLTVAARAHSEDMVARGFYDSVSPLPDSTRPEDRVAAAGYDGAVAETIYALPLSGGVSPMQFFLGWRDEPGNGAVLLDERYAATGIGLTRGTPFREDDEGPVPGATVTQDLGSEPADGDYTGLDMLIPAECPPAKAALRKAKKKLRKAIQAGERVAKAQRVVKRRRAAARRACNPASF